MTTAKELRDSYEALSKDAIRTIVEWCDHFRELVGEEYVDLQDNNELVVYDTLNDQESSYIVSVHKEIVRIDCPVNGKYAMGLGYLSLPMLLEIVAAIERARGHGFQSIHDDKETNEKPGR